MLKREIADMPEAQQLRKLGDVRRQTGMSPATIYRRVKAGAFPAPVKIGTRASAWVAAEVDRWVAARIAERDGART